MTIDTQIESLIGVAGRLIDLMEREIEILRDMRPVDLEALRSEKFDLVAAYESEYRALADNRDALVLVTPTMMEEFEAVSRRFSGTLAENVRALTAAKVAHERTMTAIIEAVKTTRKPNRSYSASGSVDANDAGVPVSMSLDCQL